LTTASWLEVGRDAGFVFMTESEMDVELERPGEVLRCYQWLAHVAVEWFIYNVTFLFVLLGAIVLALSPRFRRSDPNVLKVLWFLRTPGQTLRDVRNDAGATED
jgi:hypothetical protein